jgi:hypothetical protein
MAATDINKNNLVQRNRHRHGIVLRKNRPTKREQNRHKYEHKEREKGL